MCVGGRVLNGSIIVVNHRENQVPTKERLTIYLQAFSGVVPTLVGITTPVKRVTPHNTERDFDTWVGNAFKTWIKLFSWCFE